MDLEKEKGVAVIKKALVPFYHRYTRLRLFGSFTRTIGLASVLAFGMIWADRLAAFPARTRVAIVLCFGAVVGAYVVARLVDLFLISFDHVALCVDGHLDSTRHGVLTAWQLESDAGGASRNPAEAALAAHHIEGASTVVGALNPAQVFPRRRFVRQCRYLVPTGICLFLLLVWGGGSIIPRYFDPYSDHPPHSNMVFRVTPERPRVVYGEDIEVKVTVEGGSPDEVALFTQDETGVRQSPCFRTRGNSFTQRIEKATRPLKFWCAAGRARSKWQHLELILIPKIVSLRLRIVPPEYTLAGPKSFIVGQKPIRALKGSLMQLTVFSNRPLSGGDLTIRPLEKKGDRVEVKATRRSPHAVAFNWKIITSAQLKLSITDVEGHASREDLTLYQEAVPDEKPEVYFELPKPLVMATPESQIPYRVLARDDYGLKHLKLFRCLKNFRETVREMPLEKPYACESVCSGKFDMAALRVRPGDDIEYFGEASDYNPWALGMAASKLYQIKIISMEHYLNIQRTRARLEDLQDRYRALQRRMSRLVEEAERLQKAREKRDPKELAEARRRFQQQLDQALRMARMFTEAKALYDLEKEFQKQIEPMRRRLERLSKESDLTSEDLADLIKDMQREDQPALDGMVSQAEMITRAAWVEQLQNEFLKIVKQQNLLQRRLSPLRNRIKIPDELEPYGREQEAIEQRLKKLTEELKRQIKDLPEDLEPLKKSVEEFLTKLSELAPEKEMAKCRKACGDGDGAQAHASARAAYEKLRSLITVCNGQGLAGGVGGCQIFKPAIMVTSLRQLVMAGRAGMSGAGGAGASGGSGYAMSMLTPSNAQLAGPPVLGGGRTGSGRGDSHATPLSREMEIEREHTRTTGARAHEFRFDPNEPFPEKYREQLIEYFKRATQEPSEEPER